MDDKKLEDRLALLKSSYDRLPSTIDTDDILKKIDKDKSIEPTQVKRNKINWQRFAVWGVSLASVFVIGILSVTLLNDNQTGSEKEETILLGDIKEYEKNYAEERLKRQKILEMNDEEFKELDFVIYADNIFATQISPGSLEGKNDDTTIEEAYNQALQGLKLPSEMIEDVRNGEVMDADESMKFMEEFITKTNFLINHYDNALYKHKEKLNSAIFQGELNRNMLQANREKMPKEIQAMLKVLPKQGLNLDVNDSGTEFLVLYNDLVFTKDFSEKINDYVIGYIFLQNPRLKHYSNNNTTENEYNLMNTIRSIEYVLLNTDPSFSIHTNLENFYFTIVENILLGNSLLLDDNKKVKEEVQLVWNILADTPGESPIGTFMRGFLEVMENNDWEYTFDYKDLNMNKFRDIYNKALEGDLDYVELDWETKLPENISTSINNSKEYDAPYIYKRFVENFDKKHLHGIGPIEIAVLYDYAYDQNNLDMMWELLSDEVKQDYSKELFLEEPVDLIMDGSTMLQYDWLKTKVEGSIITTLLGQGDEKIVESNIPMRLDGDNIWRVNISLTEK